MILINTSIDQKELLRFRRILKELKNMKGRHTELVSVYIPPGYEISKVINQLKNEQGTASNIKSKTTRKNVISALERIIQHLRLHPRTPETGIAVFCGNVSEREGQPDIKLFPVIPPFPISNRIYRCSQRFVLDPLLHMMEEMETFGLIVMDRGGATIGLLHGKRIETLKTIRSMVPGKFRAGGQSAQRFERVRENLANDFYKNVGAQASEIFLPMVKDLSGIIIGGPGPTKEQFLSGEFLHHELRDKIIGVKDITYTGPEGLQELVERSGDLLAEAEVIKEKKLVQKFLERLATDNAVAYGEEDVINALKIGSAEIVLFSEKIQWYRVRIKCENCDFSYKGTVKNMELFEKKLTTQKCPKCGETRLVKIFEEDFIDYISHLAEATNSTLEIISADTTEGAQLLELGGIGAILRY